MDLFYCCDEKYPVIINELTNRGWVRLDFILNQDKKAVVPREVTLVWLNLQTINFTGIFSRTVNHIKGSHHLSNKAFLLYHLSVLDRQSYCPQSWSPVCHDIPQLLLMLYWNTLYSASRKFLKCQDMQSFAISRTLYRITQKINLRGTVLSKELAALEEELVGLTLISAEIDQSRLRRCLDTIESVDLWRRYCGDEDIWIIKPVGSSCGTDIVVVQGFYEALETVQTKFNYKCIVQKYIERPLLVRNRRKFDIRQWVLVTKANPLIVFGFSEFYLRLSMAEYSLTDLSSRHIHLCNHSVQKMCISESPSEYVCDSMMTQLEFLTELGNRGFSAQDVELMMRNLRRICVQTVDAVKDRVQCIGAGFEWLGFDLMVTESLEVLLIEVNVSPDITLSTPVTKRLVEAATADLFNLVLDERALGSKYEVGLSRLKSCTLGDLTNGHLQWSLWSQGETLSEGELSGIEIGKNKVMHLDAEYAPKNLDRCVEALSMLARERQHSRQDDKDDDEL